MAKEIEIDPAVGTSAFWATKHSTIELATRLKIAHVDRQMKDGTLVGFHRAVSIWR